MTIYRAVPDLVTGARIETKNLTLNGDLWRRALQASLCDGWRAFRQLAERDAEEMRRQETR
jgi:hypothetical protein